MQKRLTTIVGIVMTLAAVVLVKVYLDQQRRAVRIEAQRQLAKERSNQTSVLVAKTDIAKGAIIEAEMVDSAIVPNQYVQPQAVTSLDRIGGMVTVTPISKGEQITLSKLLFSKQAGANSLAMATPVGKRAITISVDNIASLGGMLSPGDYVDLIGLLPFPTEIQGQRTSQLATIPLFQNVLILAVGQDLGGMARGEGGGSRYKKEEKLEAAPLITLALTPQEANIIAFVQEQGKIRLILRSPADSQTQAIMPASWDTLLQFVLPREQITKAASEEEAKPKKVVEIYRGLQKKEVVPLSP